MEVLLVLFLVCLVFWMVKHNSHHIPGPFCLPFSGSALHMLSYDTSMLSFPYRVMHRLSQVYGAVMRVELGDQEWFVLSGWKEIKEFSMMEESTSHLPSNTFNEIYSLLDKPLGVIFPDGPLWREQRKFVAHTLSKLGRGDLSLQERVLDEVNYLSYHLEGLSPGDVRLDNLFDLPCLNVIYGLANSMRFEYGDKHVERMVEIVDKFTMNNAIGPLVGIPYLKYIPPFSGIYRTTKRYMDEFKGFMLDLVSEQKSSFNPANLRGYIDHFLVEKQKLSKNGDTEEGKETLRSNYSDEQLAVTLIDFFTGGSGTVSKTLGFCLLFCLQHSEVLKRVQSELDDLTEDEITLSSFSSLPYTEATLLETARLGSVLPIAPPRKTTGNVQVGGYSLPKGSLVQMNLYSLHRNQEHWGDPDIFRPDRFLDKKTGILVQDEWLQPFCYGKRKCLGEKMAKQTVFLIFANLMRRFRFEVSAQHPLPSVDPVGGLTIGPQPFLVRVSKRKANRGVALN